MVATGEEGLIVLPRFSLHHILQPLIPAHLVLVHLNNAALAAETAQCGHTD